jgi:streptothricin acetyltransferase
VDVALSGVARGATQSKRSPHKEYFMKITLCEMDKDTIQQVNQCDASFTVDSKLVLSAEDGKISYTVGDVPPWTKRYGEEEFDINAYLSNPDRVIFLAYLDDELAGQIRVLKYWNAYAYIEDIAVDSKHRRQGIGRALLERAIEWAGSKGCPGIMLETQDNNVAGCKLYESCGFELRGFDTYLYKGLNPSTDEIALYWYLIF